MVLNCKTCANQVHYNYCTMQKEMSDKRKIYKKCKGYKKYNPKKIIQPIIKIKKVEKTNYEELGTFGKFIKNGGHYSCRTKEFIGVNE